MQQLGAPKSGQFESPDRQSHWSILVGWKRGCELGLNYLEAIGGMRVAMKWGPGDDGHRRPEEDHRG